MLHLLLRRYGSTTDFSQIQQSLSQISRSTHIPVATILRAVRRFHQNGNSFLKRVPRRWMKIPPEVERTLCSYECLNEWRCLPLKRRVHLIKEQHDVDLQPSSLSLIYKRNGVKYSKARKATRLTTNAEAKLMVQRANFAHKLLGLPVDLLVYADETTFDVWSPPSRVWQSAECQVVIPLNKKHLKNLTVYGAIGACLRHRVYYIAQSTNKRDFTTFVALVREALVPQLANVPIHLVLDNHRAHHSKVALQAMLDHNIIVQF